MNQLILGAGNAGFMIIYVVALFALLYFLMIRPQKKQQNARNEMLRNLKYNDRILSVGGITGYIRQMNDNYIYVEIADGLVVEMSRQYVASVLKDDDEPAHEVIAEAAEEETSDDEEK